MSQREPGTFPELKREEGVSTEALRVDRDLLNTEV